MASLHLCVDRRRRRWLLNGHPGFQLLARDTDWQVKLPTSSNLPFQHQQHQSKDSDWSMVLEQFMKFSSIRIELGKCICSRSNMTGDWLGYNCFANCELRIANPWLLTLLTKWIFSCSKGMSLASTASRGIWEKFGVMLRWLTCHWEPGEGRLLVESLLSDVALLRFGNSNPYCLHFPTHELVYLHV